MKLTLQNNILTIDGQGLKIDLILDEGDMITDETPLSYYALKHFKVEGFNNVKVIITNFKYNVLEKMDFKLK